VFGEWSAAEATRPTQEEGVGVGHDLLPGITESCGGGGRDTINKQQARNAPLNYAARQH